MWHNHIVWVNQQHFRFYPTQTVPLGCSKYVVFQSCESPGTVYLSQSREEVSWLSPVSSLIITMTCVPVVSTTAAPDVSILRASQDTSGNPCSLFVDHRRGCWCIIFSTVTDSRSSIILLFCFAFSVWIVTVINSL